MDLFPENVCSDGFLWFPTALCFTHMHLGSDQYNHSPLVLVTKLMEVKSTFLRGFLKEQFDLFNLPLLDFAAHFWIEASIILVQCPVFSSLKAITASAHITFSFMTQTSITTHTSMVHV